MPANGETVDIPTRQVLNVDMALSLLKRNTALLGKERKSSVQRLKYISFHRVIFVCKVIWSFNPISFSQWLTLLCS